MNQEPTEKQYAVLGKILLDIHNDPIIREYLRKIVKELGKESK